MKMIYYNIKSLKLTTHFIPMAPSNPILSVSLQLVEKPFNHCLANHLIYTNRSNTKNAKSLENWEKMD